jgi:hypothetical protein
VKLSAREVELRAMREAQFERGRRRLSSQRCEHAAPKPDVQPAQSNRPSQSNAESNKSHAESHKPGFDRTAYQREYMRKRRAAKAAVTP